jgi:hypothetical protein
MGARSTAASVVRHVGGVATEAFLVATLVATVALVFSPVYAPARFLAGTETTLAAKSTAATLYVVFPNAATSATVDYGVAYTVTGCGYSPGSGGVTVVVQSPVAISFAGQLPDSNGCIAISNFSTQGPGTYYLSSYQTIRHRSQVMAKTAFTLQ